MHNEIEEFDSAAVFITDELMNQNVFVTPSTTSTTTTTTKVSEAATTAENLNASLSQIESSETLNEAEKVQIFEVFPNSDEESRSGPNVDLETPQVIWRSIVDSFEQNWVGEFNEEDAKTLTSSTTTTSSTTLESAETFTSSPRDLRLHSSPEQLENLFDANKDDIVFEVTEDGEKSAFDVNKDDQILEAKIANLERLLERFELEESQRSFSPRTRVVRKDKRPRSSSSSFPAYGVNLNENLERRTVLEQSLDKLGGLSARFQSGKMGDKVRYMLRETEDKPHKRRKWPPKREQKQHRLSQTQEQTLRSQALKSGPLIRANGILLQTANEKKQQQLQRRQRLRQQRLRRQQMLLNKIMDLTSRGGAFSHQRAARIRLAKRRQNLRKKNRLEKRRFRKVEAAVAFAIAL